MSEAESPLLSKRGQLHLQQLHRQLSETARTLDRSLSAFLAAVQACDVNTQREFLAEYCDQLSAHQRAIRLILQFLDHRFQLSMAKPPTLSDAKLLNVEN